MSSSVPSTAPEVSVVPVDRAQRLHISMGAVCNNNCSFCIEENRQARYESVSKITPAFVRHMLASHPNREEMCFTHGEPTLNPMLPTYVKWARELGYRRIGLITNGRQFAVKRNAALLLGRGLNHVIVSAHGSTQQRHEALTRTPGSFAQTTQGIRNLAELAQHFPLKLCTNTVINRRNADDLGGLYRHFAALGVHDVVLSFMKPIGRGDSAFENLSVAYAEVVASFLATVNQWPVGPTQVYLEDLPYCVTERVRDCHRGFVEENLHFYADDDAVYHIGHEGDEASERHYRAACAECAYRPLCPGVFQRYTEAYGWDEFVPVPQGRHSGLFGHPEVHAYQRGMKPGLRLHVTRAEADQLRARFPACEVSDVGYDRAGDGAHLRPVADDSAARVIAYPSGAADRSRRLRELDEHVAGVRPRNGLSDQALHEMERELGVLLGYPACCVEFYVGYYERHRRAEDAVRHRRYNAPHTWETLTQTAGGGSWLLNTFAPGVAPLVAHVPCSRCCARSRALARRVFDDLERRPERRREMAALRAALRRPFLHLGNDRVYLFDGEWDGAWDGESTLTYRALVGGPADAGTDDAFPAVEHPPISRIPQGRLGGGSEKSVTSVNSVVALSALADALRAGDRLRVFPDRVEVWGGAAVLGALVRRQPWDAFVGQLRDDG